MTEPSNDFGNRLLTVEQLAEKTGYKPQTIRNKVAAGEIPALKLGNRLRFRLDEIDAWLEENLEPVPRTEEA